jgi:hypothetical protein
VNWQGDKQMGLETALRELQTALVRLHEAVSALHMFIQDHPLKGETILVERLEDKTTDSLGTLEEAEAILQSVLQPADMDGRSGAARNALLSVHRRVDEFAQKYRDELFAYDNICGLEQLGSERHGEWPSWSSVVKEAIERCAGPLDAAHKAIQTCWQEGTDGMVVTGARSQPPSHMEATSST